MPHSATRLRLLDDTGFGPFPHGLHQRATFWLLIRLDADQGDPMLQELSMVEQRYLAVRDALDDGATVEDIPTRYGVDRGTEHR